MRATLQLCTYNRAPLLARVLEACFEQTAAPDEYEVVLVDDGSRDETPAVIERLRPLARCHFEVIVQANAGLARARNAGIARARGQRIIFIDDDILPMPTFVAEHVRAGASDPDGIVRGAVINTSNFDQLPPPYWSALNYSGNFFWTSNVSVGLERLRAVGAFDASFTEYGWEDIELGLRLRAAGTRARFNPRALVFHYKPPPRAADVPRMIRQARAQARTAERLRELHPNWRVVLATGDNPVQRAANAVVRRLLPPRRLERIVGDQTLDRELGGLQLFAARTLASEAYFDELARTGAN